VEIVNSPDYLTAAAALFNVFVFEKLVPLIMLVVFTWGLGAMLLKAQRKLDFRLEQMFQDDQGRVSASRTAVLGAWFLASWIMIHLTLNNKMSHEYLAVYVGAFVLNSGISKFAERPAAPPEPKP
jgi:hypothetical protein